MRTANGGLRVAYNASLSVRSRLVRLSLLLGAFGFGLSQLGPWGGDLRGQLSERVDQLLPRSYAAAAVEGARTDPATRPLPGYDVGFSVDGDRGRAWAARWQEAAPGGAPCGRPGGAPALLVTFRQPVAVERISVAAGLPDGNDERLRQARPRELDVLFSDGSCAVVQLRDSPDVQSIDVRTQEVTNARVVITDVYPAKDQSGDALATLGEVSFEARD